MLEHLAYIIFPLFIFLLHLVSEDSFLVCKQPVYLTVIIVPSSLQLLEIECSAPQVCQILNHLHQHSIHNLLLLFNIRYETLHMAWYSFRHCGGNSFHCFIWGTRISTRLYAYLAVSIFEITAEQRELIVHVCVVKQTIEFALEFRVKIISRLRYIFLWSLHFVSFFLPFLSQFLCIV